MPLAAQARHATRQSLGWVLADELATWTAAKAAPGSVGVRIGRSAKAQAVLGGPRERTAAQTNKGRAAVKKRVGGPSVRRGASGRMKRIGISGG